MTLGVVMGGWGTIAAVVSGLLLFLFLFLYIYATRYTKVGPNQALVVSGARQQVRGPKGKMETIGFRIVKGGGTFVFPVFEQAEVLSLEIIASDFSVTSGGRAASGTLQVKIPGDEMVLRAAAEILLSKPPEQVAAVGREIVEGHLRGILERDGAADRGAIEGKVRSEVSEDLGRIGLELVSFSVKELKDA